MWFTQTLFERANSLERAGQFRTNVLPREWLDRAKHWREITSTRERQPELSNQQRAAGVLGGGVVLSGQRNFSREISVEQRRLAGASRGATGAPSHRCRAVRRVRRQPRAYSEAPWDVPMMR